jgi:opacity protein-like surface antigen
VKRFLSIAAVAVVLCLVATPPVMAGPMGLAKLGVGAYGVTAFPVVQDDAGTGTLLGARVRLGLVPILMLEGSYTKFNLGDKDVSGTNITLQAPEESTWSINAMLRSSGVGFSMYLTGGIGTTKLKVPQAGDESKATYNVGIGAEIGLGPVSLDLSPRLYIINNADGASRKNLAGLAGLTYYFF